MRVPGATHSTTRAAILNPLFCCEGYRELRKGSSRDGQPGGPSRQRAEGRLLLPRCEARQEGVPVRGRWKC